MDDKDGMAIYSVKIRVTWYWLAGNYKLVRQGERQKDRKNV